jgi:hypothetical protein
MYHLGQELEEKYLHSPYVYVAFTGMMNVLTGYAYSILIQKHKGRTTSVIWQIWRIN